MKKKSKRTSFKKNLIMILLGSVLIFSLVTTTYAFLASKMISEKLSNDKIWAIPSRVMGASMVLYPGQTFSPKEMDVWMAQLSMIQNTQSPLQIGQFQKRPGQTHIYFPPFVTQEGAQPSKEVVIDFEGNQIKKIAVRTGDAWLDTQLFVMPAPELNRFFNAQNQQRTFVSLKEVPQLLINGILLMEDRRFYQHHGISASGILRALATNLLRGKVSQGGSTLTQQLMKNFFLSSNRTLVRKYKEAIFTLVVEGLYTKEQILEAYINEIYLAQKGSVSIHGFEEAAQFYFAKPLSLTTPPEQALLVGLISSPGGFSPHKDYEKAMQRKNLVLKVLFEHKEISEQNYQKWKSEKLKIKPQVASQKIAPYFLDFVEQELKEEYSASQLREEGLTVFTHLDVVLQKFAEQAVEAGMKELQFKAKQHASASLEVALITLQPSTGGIKAFVGGKSYANSQYNRVSEARRQVGSAIKPFVVASALNLNNESKERWITPATLLEDKATTFSFANQEWSPKNFSGKYMGQVTLQKALEDSLNVPFVNLLSGIGLTPMVEGLKKFKFSNVPAVPSIALGALEASPLELARAYAALANQGLLVDVHGISMLKSASGHSQTPKIAQFEQVVKPEVAFQTSQMLLGVSQRGSAKEVGKRFWEDISTKTGTTSNHKDNWFVAYTPMGVTVVWVGFDHNESTGLTGASAALKIWIKYMSQVLQFRKIENFENNFDMEWVFVDEFKGCKTKEPKGVKMIFVKGTAPQKCKD